jgi:trans-2,3-dihydro-3-hydroxyanthranilate isomerase
MRNPLHVVDVFARERYTGNQLAVVEDANSLADEEMQAFAAEIGFSETTFVGERSADGWDVRIFTPEAEIPFAGHPTIGTAHVVREHIATARPETVTLDLDVGSVPVEVRERDDHETLWMTQQPPAFTRELSHEALAAVLSLDLAALDTRWPVQIVSTGLPTIVVPLDSREALTDIEVDRDAYDTVTGGREAKNVLAFCRNPRNDDNDLAVRVFAPFYGVPEDPATGSSNGCLAAYLVHHELLGTEEIDVRVEQGYEMGRPSLIHLQARPVEGHIRIEEGGHVVPVARGQLASADDPTRSRRGTQR